MDRRLRDEVVDAQAADSRAGRPSPFPIAAGDAVPAIVRLLLAGPGHLHDGDARRRAVDDAARGALALLDADARDLVCARLWHARTYYEVARVLGADEGDVADRCLSAMRAWRTYATGLLNGRVPAPASP